MSGVRACKKRGYHKFFEGYTEQTVQRDGKWRIERVYRGNYYRMLLTDREWRWRKILYGLFYIAITALYVWVAVRPVPMNILRLTGICHGLTSIVLLWLFGSVFSYVLAKKNIKTRDYRWSSLRLRRLSLAAAILFAVMSVLYLILTIGGIGQWSECIELFPFTAIACTISFFMYYLEKRVKYEVIPAGSKDRLRGNEMGEK